MTVSWRSNDLRPVATGRSGSMSRVRFQTQADLDYIKNISRQVWPEYLDLTDNKPRVHHVPVKTPMGKHTRWPDMNRVQQGNARAEVRRAIVALFEKEGATVKDLAEAFELSEEEVRGVIYQSVQP